MSVRYRGLALAAPLNQAACTTRLRAPRGAVRKSRDVPRSWASEKSRWDKGSEELLLLLKETRLADVTAAQITSLLPRDTAGRLKVLKSHHWTFTWRNTEASIEQR